MAIEWRSDGKSIGDPYPEDEVITERTKSCIWLASLTRDGITCSSAALTEVAAVERLINNLFGD